MMVTSSRNVPTFRRMLRWRLAVLVLCLCLAGAYPCAAESSLSLPPPTDKLLDLILGIPPNLAPGNSLDDPLRPQIQKPKPATPQNILPVFLGIPYREDGIINDDGQYATFNAPDVTFQTPGLNCSGFTLAASRIILKSNLSVAETIHDREGDSGPNAKDGHDWDFGFDLVMNISEGLPRTILAPQKTAVPEPVTGKTVPTFDPHGESFALDLLPQIQEKGFYLVSFSRHAKPDSPPRLHYHTGIIVREDSSVWLYSTTTRSGKLIRHNLATEEGLSRFRASFSNTKGSYKRLTVIFVHPDETP